MVVTGIDEAGYGPVLGPLTVTAVSLAVPGGAVGRGAWDLLREVVTDRPSARDARLVIADSKVLSSRRDGLARLETAVLAVASCSGRRVRTFRDVLGWVCPEDEDALDRCPWYAGRDFALPLVADAGAVRVASAALRRGLRRAGMAVVGVRSRVLPAWRFNVQVAQVRNKAEVLLQAVVGLVWRAWREVGRSEHVVAVDRLGGRFQYGRGLMTLLDQRRLEIVRESAAESEYCFPEMRPPLRVRFVQGGERAYFAIAVASIVSKYLREVCMHALNEYWAREVGEVRRTKGYYTDGRRFLREVGRHLARLGIARETLVRSR